MATESMHRLSTAASFKEDDLEDHQVSVEYESGAKFEGTVINHKRVGKGTFVWPNGSKYEGDYADNQRHGIGTQHWSDGSYYTGEFEHDLRHGSGKIVWSNGESYEGIFFKDRRHGKGTYQWPSGSSYSGTFYMDKKEGYGTFVFENGDVFQGLYKEDEREGPGVITYQNGQEDVGLWSGEKLIKLCSPIKGAFTLNSCPEFDFKPEENISYIDMSEKDDTCSTIDHILNPEPAFDYMPKPNLSNRIQEILSPALDSRSLAVNRKAFDAEFFKNFSQQSKTADKVEAWNATPSLIALQKHTIRHSDGASSVQFDVESVLKLDRSKFKGKGPLERQSEELIKAATKGDASRVELLLSSGQVHPDVADRDGYTPLIGATVNWHIDVINILLNQGADVNKLSDEGCSALAAGAIFYYPIEGFTYNIAERFMKPLQDILKSTLKPETQPKGILVNTKERRVSRLNQINRIRSQSVVSAPINLASKSVSLMEQTSTLDDPDNEEISNLLNENSQPIPDEDADSAYGGENDIQGDDGEKERNEEGEDFESNHSIRNYHIEVSEQLVERCATHLSQNERVISREASEVGEGKARFLAIQLSQNERMKETLDLLLRRGADPNASFVPMPVLFFAIKSADVDMVKQLLLKGANPNTKLGKERGGLYPLHIACAITGEEGIQITELLLNALADPDARAAEDDSFLNKNLEEEWLKDPISEESKQLLGGRTALQIACARDDNYKNASRVVRLLLEHKANSSLICNGFSALALAIASGNDLAIDELLAFGADPSLPLTHGVGSALCVATSTEYEHQRSIQTRVQLVDKLIKAGADVLAPILIGPKRQVGTAVDYAYYMFNQDRRIAHMPYHALTHAERETYNARRKLLGHIGDIMRIKAVEREKKRNVIIEKEGIRCQSASTNFVYIGAGAKLPPGVRSRYASAHQDQNQVVFDPTLGQVEGQSRASTPTKKPLFKYCYECGRSVGVRLVPCTRCKEVYYCSKACKMKAWNSRHKEECIRVGGHSRSPSPKHRGDSPTAATVAERNKKTAGSQKILASGRSVKTRTRSSSSHKSSENESARYNKSDSYIENEQSEIDEGRERSWHSRSNSEILSKSGSAKSGSRYGSGSLNDKNSSNRNKRNKKQRAQLNYNKRKQFVKGRVEVPGSMIKDGKLDSTVYRRSNKIILPPLNASKNNVPVKGLSKSAQGERKQAKHKFRTGSPPHYDYVFIDNYSHN